MRILFAVACFMVIQADCAPSPPQHDRSVFHSMGSFAGGDTHNLNLEKIELLRTSGVERIDISFSAGSRNVPSRRVPPYQLRYDLKSTASGRLLLLLQGIAGRNVHRLTLNSLTSGSALIQNVKIFPPLEGGDTVVEFTLKKRVEFRPELDGRGRIRISMREAPSTP